MCGINGIIHFKQHATNLPLVQQSIARMHYRGPDYQDFFEDQVATLGHARLSIVDLNARSHQPFHSACGRYVMVYNGEAYNFNELRQTMQAKGFNFRSSSDTEVLLEGFIQQGAAILQQLRGMWALVIWDKHQQKAFIVRDRFGEKPFYYFWDESQQLFAFASNLAGLKSLLGKQMQTINPDAVWQLLNYSYILGHTCIYQNVKKLPPAHCGWFSKNGLEIKPYWQLGYKQKHGKNYAQIKEEANHLLMNSVAEKLIADVPVGLFLSGGVDSGVITGMASKLKKEMVAITMTVPNNEQYNEEQNAAKVAAHCGLQHHKVALDQSCIEILPHVLSSIEPLADNSLIPSLFVAKYAGSRLKVMLSGDGGDEFFGGYGTPLKYANTSSKATVFSDRLIKKVLQNGYSTGYHSILKRLTTDRMIKWAKPSTLYRYNFLSQDLADQLFIKKHPTNQEPLVDAFTNAFQFASNTADAVLYTGITTRMANDFLYKMDSANMFFSVESRAPFLDHRIAELTTGANITDLMPNGIDKQMLKEMGEAFIPKAVLYAPKKGFAIPIVDYLNKKWLASLETMAAEGCSQQAGIFTTNGLLFIIQLYKKNGSHRLARLLYAILIFELWLRVFHLEMNAGEVAKKYLI